MPASGRLRSLDAYRGFIMLAMLSGGFGFLEISQRFPNHPVWAFLATQFNHAPWAGYTFWDLIQPSFMFMVGVAIPFSYARRREAGESDRRIFAHAFLRAGVLVFLGLVGVFMLLRVALFKAPWPVPVQTTHILTQIGLTYGLAYPFVRLQPAAQLAAAVAILAATYVAYVLYPAPVHGLFAHFQNDTNLGMAWDRWLVNLNPDDWLDRVHPLGLTSLNFVPGVSTVLAGMIAGESLRGPGSARAKTAGLLGAAAICFAAGTIMGIALCPVVKLIWTPSFVLVSTGWTLAMLAGFYGIIDLKGWRRWSLPFVVVGMNSITLFLLYFVVDWWIKKAWTLFVGPGLFASTYGPLWSNLATLLTLWGVAVVLYWRRIFLRL